MRAYSFIALTAGVLFGLASVATAQQLKGPPQTMHGMDQSNMQGMQGMDHSKMPMNMQGMEHSKMPGMQNSGQAGQGTRVPGSNKPARSGAAPQ